MKRIILALLAIFSFVQLLTAQNVGIGTTTPNNSALLDINSTTKGLLIPRMSSFNRVLIPSPANGLLVYDTTTNRVYQYQEGDWHYLLDDNFWKRSNSRNWVYSLTDSIAIGVTSATQRLDVNGNVRVRNNLFADDNLLVRGNNTTEGDLYIKNSSALFQLQNTAADNKAFFQLSGDDLRLGTNSGNTAGSVYVRMNGNNRFQFTNDGRMTLLADITPTIHFNTGGTNRAFIQLQGDNLRLLAPGNRLNLGDDMVVDDATGRVGIGTLSPAVKFHVVGNARVTGNLHVYDSLRGSILTGGVLSVGGGDAIQGLFAFGLNSYVDGPYSGAMGQNARVQHAFNSFVIGTNVGAARDGCVVLSDSRTDRNFISFTTRPHTMYGMFHGGYQFFTGIGTGVEMENGDNSWSSISDSTKKENFLYADGSAFLQKIAKMKLGSWNYKVQDKSKRHYGPMAQEFHSNFGNDGFGKIGNDTTIATADIDGVMMIALQALEKRTSDQQATIDELKKEITDLKAILNEQKKVLEGLTGTSKKLAKLGE